MMETPSELSLLTTSEIFSELGRRFRGVLLVTVDDPLVDIEARDIRYHGGRSLALGMSHVAAAVLAASVSKYIEEDDIPADGEDEEQCQS